MNTSMKGGADAPPNLLPLLLPPGTGIGFNEGRGRCPAKLYSCSKDACSITNASMKGGADAPPNCNNSLKILTANERLQ